MRVCFKLKWDFFACTACMPQPRIYDHIHKGQSSWNPLETERVWWHWQNNNCICIWIWIDSVVLHIFMFGQCHRYACNRNILWIDRKNFFLDKFATSEKDLTIYFFLSFWIHPFLVFLFILFSNFEFTSVS